MRHPGNFCLHRRLRRRGPRSQAALLRRQSHHYVSPTADRTDSESSLILAPGEESCESDSISPAIGTDISILHCNIRGFASHRNELEVQLDLMPSKPYIIALNESFLDQSTITPSLSGYILSRHNLSGDFFKILGCQFDCKLVMHEYIHDLVSSIN